MDNYDKLINEYIENAKIQLNIEYGDKNSVKRGNKAIEKMIKISKKINVEFSERIIDFSKLLEMKEDRIDIWVAHHLLENMNYTKEIERKAISVIERYSKEDSIEGLGNRMWLAKWNK